MGMGSVVHHDDVIVDIGPWTDRESLAIHLTHRGQALGCGARATVVDDEFAILGKQLEQAVEIVLPHTVAVAGRQVADRFTVEQCL